ncbi:hypothetical protein ACI2KE_20960 [Pseudomonas monteilii]
MTSNSKADLLERLTQDSVMHAWGAIVALDGEQLNQMLKQRYLAAFNELSFLLPFTLEVSPGDTPEAKIVLNNLVFGIPRLSFEAAQFSDNKTTLTLDILAGSMTRTYKASGRPPVLLDSTNLDARLGHCLQMTVRLSAVNGLVDGRRRLAIDLTKATGFTCSLGLDRQVELELAQIMGERIHTLPAYRQVFTVAMLDLHNDGPLSVQHFEVLTQPHPDPLKAEKGVGAAVLFCQLRVDDESGRLPAADGRFPYLIPDDADTLGSLAFNATVLTDNRLRKFFPVHTQDVAARLAFPNAHVLGQREIHDPLDRVTFTRVNTTEQSWFVEPLQAQVAASATRKFQLVNGSGSKASVTASQWEATNLQRQSTGSIQADGTYQASARPVFRQNQQVVIVSNTFDPPGQPQARRTSIAVEYANPVTIAPTAKTWRKGEGAVDLIASAAGSASWSWSLEGETYGKLTSTGELATFEPDTPQPGGDEILLQRIRATNTSGSGEYAEATVIIIAYDGTLTVIPEYVPAIDATQPIQFRLDPPRADVTWSCFGEGHIASDGVFTPPEKPNEKITVVMADIDDRLSGYAVVELATEAVSPPTWTELTEFSLEVRGSNKCIANGMQQVELLVTIETKSPIGQGKWPVSPCELSTLKLYDEISNTQLQFLAPEEEGLPPDSRTPWAVSTMPNRFRFQDTGMPAMADNDPDATRRRLLYLHSGEATKARKIYAKFTKDDGREYSSRDHSGTAEIQSEDPPIIDDDHYTLKRERVENIRGSDVGGEEDPFSYWTASLDYWTLTYKVHGSGPTVKFLTCEAVGPVSAVRWESEQLNEIFGSVLTCAFNPYKGEAPEGLTVDPWLKLLATEEKVDFGELRTRFVDGRGPAPGDLMISLHRTDNLTYWHDKMGAGQVFSNYRAHLEQGLKFRLRDVYGNLHQVLIDFPHPTASDHRNILTLRRW